MARNTFNVDEKLESQFNIQHLKRIGGYLAPYKKTLIITVFIMLIASLSNILVPMLMKITIDDIIPSRDLKQLISIVIVFILTIVVSGICLHLRIKIMSRMGQDIIATIRKDQFIHLQKLPFTYYDSRPHGKILVRVVNYVNSLSDLLSNGLINVITDLFSLFLIIGFMFALNVQLTLICLLILPVMSGLILWLKNAQRKSWQTLSNKQSNMNAYIHESISGMKVTQSFAREEVNLGIFRELMTNYKNSWMNNRKIAFLIWPIVDNSAMITRCLVIGIGILMIGEGITAGVLVAFIGYVGRFWGPIINISNFYNQLISAMAYLERIFETLDEEPDVKDAINAYEMPSLKGEVSFKNVTFGYEEGQKILDDVTFHVKQGETIALVGPTGAGKTTVINLISRFYNLNEGCILIDDHDISQVTLKSLRKQMGIMLQDSFIFSGTIMENIRYGKLDASDEEVVAASKAIKAHDFIMEMEEGYETQVNERGSRLSVGQRQLISFARALLADPRILILDEATSSIDTQTEKAVQEGLEKLLKGRTSFVIAHRLSTIRNADKIMVINNRKIEEEGNHEVLMKQKGHYYNLYITQNRFLA